MTQQRYDSWVISAVFNKLYERKGFSSIREAARFLFMNHSTLTRWLEGDTVVYDPQKVRGVAISLGASTGMARHLFDLAVQTHDTSASGFHLSADPEAGLAHTPFTLIEAGAERIDIYEESLIAGLLQCIEYIKAFASLEPSADREFVEKVLRFKLERQAAIFGSKVPEMRVVLNEAALLRIAHCDFYEAQIDHMLDLIERYGIGIYVLPMSAGLHRAMFGPFVLMGFDQPVEREIGFLESYGAAGEWVEDRSTLDRFRRLYKSTLQRCVELGAYANADRGMAQIEP
ncbi:Scr1 family TA system antitoxin-like transcriptional regulator [Glycomyces sp. A-F 0318]|uniref:Scr1 family TA system antitoxin-like transcriptional regulator n=1 Tax=Glycomyces amatae TaxID=2881355 RepID=UPI001E55DABC|nr:Scr1 family TA system antitoxin-like transcriptional regulator [Glycomyces amatae]MCD0444873.1 Scr1 family TA system antitoxin-like transcriptional regulator [Glycomyces amatae]